MPVSIVGFPLDECVPMALKATIYKAHLQIADMDRGLYADHQLTIAKHPSETDERLGLRVLAFALQVPHGSDNGALEMAAGLSDPDAPDLWQRDLTGEIVHWVELGQPDERRMMKASSRATQVTVYSYAASTPIWWNGVKHKVERAGKVAVWQIDAAQAEALTAMVQRGLQWQINIQDGTAWVSDGSRTAEITPVLLKPRAGAGR